MCLYTCFFPSKNWHLSAIYSWLPHSEADFKWHSVAETLSSSTEGSMCLFPTMETVANLTKLHKFCCCTDDSKVYKVIYSALHYLLTNTVCAPAFCSLKSLPIFYCLAQSRLFSDLGGKQYHGRGNKFFWSDWFLILAFLVLNVLWLKNSSASIPHTFQSLAIRKENKSWLQIQYSVKPDTFLTVLCNSIAQLLWMVSKEVTAMHHYWSHQHTVHHCTLKLENF